MGHIKGAAALALTALAGAALLVGLGPVPGASASDAKPSPAWRLLPTPPYTLNNKQDAIAFASPSLGWYGNGLGRIYKTVDGGLHWQEVWRKPGTYVRALEFIDEKTGFMGNVGPGYFPGVVDRQPLYVTRDGGRSWSPVSMPPGAKVVGICAIDILKDHGRAVAIRAAGRVGGPAAVVQSFDGGRTWTVQDLSRLTGMIVDIKFVSPDVGFIAGATDSDERRSHAQILKSTDGGRSWRTVYVSRRPVENTWKLAFPTKSTGYVTVLSYDPAAANVNRFVAKTTDGGETWREMLVAKDKSFIEYGIAFINARHGWVGGFPRGYETRDGGATWAPSLGMGLSVNKIRMLPTRTGHRLFSVGKDVRRLDLPS